MAEEFFQRSALGAWSEAVDDPWLPERVAAVLLLRQSSRLRLGPGVQQIRRPSSTGVLRLEHRRPWRALWASACSEHATPRCGTSSPRYPLRSWQICWATATTAPSTTRNGQVNDGLDTSHSDKARAPFCSATRATTADSATQLFDHVADPVPSISKTPPLAPARDAHRQPRFLSTRPVLSTLQTSTGGEELRIRRDRIRRITGTAAGLISSVAQSN